MAPSHWSPWSWAAAAKLLVPVVQLGKGLDAQPGGVLVRMPREGEEPGLRRGGVGLRGLEPRMRGADVIGHHVQQVAHAPVGQGAPQARQFLVASEMPVDMLVVDEE